MSSNLNNCSSVSKTVQFERPIIPPILSKMTQNQKPNSKYSNSILTIDSSNKYNRQKELLQQMKGSNCKSSLSQYNQPSTNQITSRTLQHDNQYSSEQSFKAFNQNLIPSNLANTFPSFYMNPNETNYTKLISSILNSKNKLKANDKSNSSINVSSTSQNCASSFSFKSSSIANFENSSNQIFIDSKELISNFNSTSLVNDFNKNPAKVKPFVSSSSSSSSTTTYRLNNLPKSGQFDFVSDFLDFRLFENLKLKKFTEKYFIILLIQRNYFFRYFYQLINT